MHPRHFFNTFTQPAFDGWKDRPDQLHLASSAIIHLDILADVVARHTRQNPAEFRDALAKRCPMIQLVRDACNSQKHGRPISKSRKEFREGQRVELMEKFIRFSNATYAGAATKKYARSVIILDDGARLELIKLLSSAMAEWEAEFASLEL